MSLDLDLEKLYSPSRWSKRFATAEEVVTDHIIFAQDESLRMRQKWPFEAVWFGSRAYHESFDIYGTHLPNDAPIFVYIHGGYWHILGKDASAYCVNPLMQAGCKVVVMDFELCPKVSLKQQMDQVYQAGVAILDYAAKMGAKCVNFAGHSSGSHLLISLMDRLISERHPHTALIRTIYPISGVFDLTELRFTDVANPNNILGLHDGNVVEYSPMFFDFSKWINYPVRIKLFVGEFEPPRFIQQSSDFQKRVAEKTFNAKCSFRLIENYDHFNIVNDLSKAMFVITNTIINDFE